MGRTIREGWVGRGRKGRRGRKGDEGNEQVGRCRKEGKGKDSRAG